MEESINAPNSPVYKDMGFLNDVIPDAVGAQSPWINSDEGYGSMEVQDSKRQGGVIVQAECSEVSKTFSHVCFFFINSFY